MRNDLTCGQFRGQQREMAIMSAIDPWVMAAECTRALGNAKQRHDQSMLQQLQQMWIAVGNELSLFTQQELEREAHILKLQLDLPATPAVGLSMRRRQADRQSF